ncbi:MAG: CPBP family intramembrane metalloprotease [Maritimibacter sp.]|nr:CPBP family intramembrane metalloprotease [Maritimibacter sp.]
MIATDFRFRTDPVPGRALLPFFSIAFGLSWGIFAVGLLFTDAVVRIFGELGARNPLFFLAVYAPAIAAFVLVLAHTGPHGLGRFLSRLGLWRCSWGWWAFLLLGIPAIYAAGALVKGLPPADLVPRTAPGALLSAIGFMLILGPMEEFGWRGFALPFLQRRMAPVWAGFVLGLIWGIWHLPAFMMSGTPQSNWSFPAFLIGATAISVILTPLFNRSGGSILLPMLYHFQLNNPAWPDAQPWDTWFFVAVALVVVWLHRDTMFSRDVAITEVVPT